ncbi:MAG: hypothetical protein DRQ88_10955 [Epsilonproteobacteria bacterium]|nr:MAG: hypothetical protein DRQ89_11160 [Campylobacterota bacterium]RLA64420.1 MAG: hypothetical protein DRQ88_10955 [Campylobacterota bacterium]
MKIKSLLLPIFFCTLTLAAGCLNPKQALDLIDAIGDMKPSNGWVERIVKSESFLNKEHGLKFNRNPIKGELKSYNIRVPREANINKVLDNLETYQIELDRFLSYYDGEFNRREEFEKKLEAVKGFLDNYDRKDEYFTSPSFSHD